MNKLSYPYSMKVDQIDDYHGTLVHDPYRWLEEVDSPETKAWIEQQNQLTFSILDRIPSRRQIRQRLTELWDYPKASAPVKRGGFYFQFRNSGLQNQDVLYVSAVPGKPGRILLDPNILAEDGTIALTNWEVSKDGRWLAYACSSSGSDWTTWRVRNVETGEDLPDQIEWSKFSGAAWLSDGSGFYYSRYDPPSEGQAYEEANYYQKVYLHRLGTTQSRDVLIYQRPDQKEWGFEATLSDDGQYLLLHIWQGTDTRNRFFFKDLQEGNDFVELIADLEAAFEFVGNDGPRFYFRTDLEAPRGRLIAIPTDHPKREHWVTLIPEKEDKLETVKMVNNQFIALYLHDAYNLLQRFNIDGSFLGNLPLPDLGSIVSTNLSLSLFGEREDTELFYAYHSFLIPPSVYRYDFYSEENELLEKPTIQFDSSRYTTRQVFAQSKDGTRIPMFLVHQKDLELNGKNPTLLYGYGGFDISLTPSFMIIRLVWLEMGGVLAVANLRGGGEYGEDWHQAGSRINKQNVFDDMIACAEYLVENKITSTRNLALEGRSNGGLLVGACITQRPDLFGAALPAVGVMDMLRFHKFTIGWAWVSDYGSAEDPALFEALYRYSPLHNIKTGTSYPATLITTGDHDDRVVPGHSFKFAAALQAAQSGEAPILIRVQAKAGHGFGKPTTILIEEQADIWAFLAEYLGIAAGEEVTVEV
jgi:prolyl oligopeptidase